jgi:hypothetical protein
MFGKFCFGQKTPLAGRVNHCFAGANEQAV